MDVTVVAWPLQGIVLEVHVVEHDFVVLASLQTTSQSCTTNEAVHEPVDLCVVRILD